MSNPNDALTAEEALNIEADEQVKKTRKTRTPKPKIEGLSGKKEQISARQLTGVLIMGHSALASSLKQPLLAIDDDEATEIAKAVIDVMNQYDFKTSAKTLAWANLIGVCATVYGLKYISFKVAKEKAILRPNDRVDQPVFE